MRKLAMRKVVDDLKDLNDRGELSKMVENIG